MRAWNSHAVRPLIPIGLVGVEGPHQRAVAALGTEVDVDTKAAPCDLEECAGSLRGAMAVAVADEHQVDVARVVELVATELAHPDRRQWVAGTDQRRRHAEDIAGHRRDRGNGRFELVATGEVSGRDAKVLARLSTA